MAERPTFSPFWHRVRAMKPRLRPHVQITRQHYRGRRWHVVHDPATNQFYRLTPVAHELVGLLDGTRSVEEAWQLSLTRHADDAPTQNEVIQLLSQLYSANLLSAEAAPETEQLLRRGRERRGKKLKQQAIGLMYLKVRLFNPDGFFAFLAPILRPLLGPWGFVAWLGLIGAALWQILPHSDDLRAGFSAAVAPGNWIWLIVVYVALKAIHETGHGVLCRRFGGQVPEFGCMLLVLFPSPYVDASACWAFPSKWQRIAVGAGGMLFELTAAALAAFVWLATRDGSNPMLNQIAYNAMLTASVSTVLFNANPLMRFDGYYMLSDLLEIPNLMQRSTSMLKYFAQRHLYGVKQATAPSSNPGERWILTIFGVTSTIYRVFLFFAITLYVMGQFFAIGVVLAVWTAAMWFILPVASFVHWLATHQQLEEMRGRAIALSLLLIGATLALVGAVPMPDHRRGQGVVESPSRTGVFAPADGFLEQLLARPGDTVREGDTLAVLRSDELVMQLKMSHAALREARALEQEMTVRNEAAAQVTRRQIEALLDQVAFLEKRVEGLKVRAPISGVIVGRDPGSLLGSYVREGQPICTVLDPSRTRVAAALSQAEATWLFEVPRSEYSVEIRRHSNPRDVRTGGDVRAIDAGQRALPHPALGFAGGGEVETAARDQTGLEAKRPQFTVYVEGRPGAGPLGVPGERVVVRFTLPSRPLLGQWVDALRRTLQGRVNL